MTFWLLFVLGLITYTILKRNVASITRTPVWLLWLVMMTPATVLTVWELTVDPETPVPPSLAFGTFFICFAAYWWLVSAGRIPPQQQTERESIGSAEKDSTPNQFEADVSETGPTSELEAETDDESESGQDSSYRPKALKRPIDAEEEMQLRNCFSWSIYALRDLEMRPQVIICRGNLRTDPERAYKTVCENIKAAFGDRFFVIFQEDGKGQPFFLLAPNPQAEFYAKGSDRKQSLSFREERPWVAVALLLISLFTTSVAGVYFSGFDLDLLPRNPSWLLVGFPYALSLLGILAAHELGHFWAARSYELQTSLPYFIPFPYFLGTLGAFVQMRSPMPDRKALFDVGVAGPITGFVLALPLFIWGAAHSSVVALTENTNLLNFTELQPQFSLLISLVFRVTLPEGLDPSQAVSLHPVAIAGYLGLILTAFNLMPVGTLDGGHIVHAMFGRRQARTIGNVARGIMMALTLLNWEFLAWTLLLFLLPSQDEPALNDLTELDDRRDAIGLGCMALLVMILLPAPKILWTSLGF